MAIDEKKKIGRRVLCLRDSTGG